MSRKKASPKLETKTIFAKLAEETYHEGWWILIEWADNGFIVTRSPCGRGGSVVREVVSEPSSEELEKPIDESEAEAKLAARLAWTVIDNFTLQGSKHNKYRIRIEAEKLR